MTTVYKTDEELVAEFEKEIKTAKEQSKSFDNFFLRLTEDEQRAIFHPLLNYPQISLTRLQYHEKYDKVTKKFVADNVCATPFGQTCKFCQEAEQNNDKDLKASLRFFLPVYVHGIWNKDLVGQLVAVTEKDDAGNTRPIKGVRFLKMKLRSDLLTQFATKYKEAEDDSILSSDFEYARSGKTMQDTTYTLTRRKKLLPMPADILPHSVDRVISDVRLHREEQIIEVPEIEPADDEPAPVQATVKETLDIVKPSEASLKRIQELCDLLGEKYIEPVSAGQAINMKRNLSEKYAAFLAEDDEEESRERLPLNGQREVKTERGVPVR